MKIRVQLKDEQQNISSQKYEQEVQPNQAIYHRLNHHHPPSALFLYLVQTCLLNHKTRQSMEKIGLLYLLQNIFFSVHLRKQESSP